MRTNNTYKQMKSLKLILAFIILFSGFAVKAQTPSLVVTHLETNGNTGVSEVGTVLNYTITLTYTVTVDTCGEFVNQAEIINSSMSDPDSTPNSGG